MSEKLTYRDYLIQQVAHASHALTQGIREAINMNDNAYAEKHLERTIDVGRALLSLGAPNSERVEARVSEGDAE